MGYAVPGQRGSGIHLRLRARSYVISDGIKRVAFVSVDGGMASDLVKMRVVEKLKEELGEAIYSTVRLFVRIPLIDQNVKILIYFEIFILGKFINLWHLYIQRSCRFSSIRLIPTY